MTVVFDAEPLVAFAFDEPGASEVEGVLDDVYDGEIDAYVTTVNLAEFRYVATRRSAIEAADAHVSDLEELGVSVYGVDDLWKAAAGLKADCAVSLGDAYAVAAASDLAESGDGGDVRLVVGADGDFDGLPPDAALHWSIDRFRTDPA